MLHLWEISIKEFDESVKYSSRVWLNIGLAKFFNLYLSRKWNSISLRNKEDIDSKVWDSRHFPYTQLSIRVWIRCLHIFCLLKYLYTETIVIEMIISFKNGEACPIYYCNWDVYVRYPTNLDKFWVSQDSAFTCEVRDTFHLYKYIFRLYLINRFESARARRRW
jgi:hypothetical protein